MYFFLVESSLRSSYRSSRLNNFTDEDEPEALRLVWYGARSDPPLGRGRGRRPKAGAGAGAGTGVESWKPFFPEIEEVGFSLDYTRSGVTFVSFCCKPSAISSSAVRIARSRRGEAIRGVGPLNGAGVEISILA